MSTVAQVTSQSSNDPNIMVFHTRFEMSEGPEAGTRGHACELGEFGQLFLEIRGVSQVHVTPYVLLITKAQLFEWDEITPSVTAILEQFVRSQKPLDIIYTIVELEKIRLEQIRSLHRIKELGPSGAGVLKKVLGPGDPLPN